MFDDDPTMTLKYITDMYRMVDLNNKERAESLRNIKIQLISIYKLNVSAFKDIDFLEMLQFEVSGIVEIITNTPIQTENDDKFFKFTDLVMTELTDPIRRPRLIQMYVRDWVLEVLKRINRHFKAIGLIEYTLGTQIQLGGQVIGKMREDIERSMGDSLNDEDEFQF